MLTGELAERARRLARDRQPFVVATVVRARRPTSVRPGDSAVVTADGAIEGFVGGVCAESTVRLYSLRAMETGEPVLLRLVPDDSESDEAPEGAVVEHNPCLSGGALEIFLEPRLPSARIVVVGAAPIAGALCRIAGAAGYDVLAMADGDVPPLSGDAAVIVASHGAGEERVLAEALTAGVPYVALVASATRGEAVRAALHVPDELRAQLHTPAGLDIGSRTPSEIAISILAELIAEHHAHPASAPALAAVASVVDPVCGMQVAISEATPYLELGGQRVYFCGPGCRDAYAAEHAAR
jgi:xanthine dehydrogenase accessory factor